MQLVKKLHPSSAGLFGLFIGGVIRLLAFYLHWPLGLVLLASVILFVSIAWIIIYDFFPLFLHPFYAIRKNFPQRFSFFFILLILFFVFQLVTYVLPSGRGKDLTTNLAFLSFISSAVWIIGVYVVNTFTPLFYHFNRNTREVEKVTVTDIIMSMAVAIAPMVFLSFIFASPGLGRVQVTPYQLFASSILTALFIGTYLYLYVVKPKVFTWRQLGFRSVDREDIGRSLVMFLFVSVLIVILQTLLQRFGLSVQQYSFTSREGALMALIGTVVITPFIEELYFRGFLFKGLLLHNKPWVAYVVSSGLFALLHPPLAAMIDVFLIGLLLAYVMKQTRSIWPCVLIHALNNLIVFGYLLYK